MKLDERLYQLRKNKGLTQADVAEKLGISRQAVSRWEIGAAVPTLEKLKELSELFEVPLDYLMPGDYESADDNLRPINEQTNEDGQSKESRTSFPESFQGTDLWDKESSVEGTEARKHFFGGKKIWVGVVVVAVFLAILTVAWIYSQQASPKQEDAWLSELDVDHNESQVGEDFQFE